MALTDQLVSYWSLNEASGNALDAHGSHPLTETGGTIASAAGKVGNARDFEAGDTEYFEHADHADFSRGDTDWTWQAWVNAETFGSFPYVFSKDNNANTQREYGLYYNTSTNRFAFYVTANGTNVVEVVANNFGAASVGTWYCIHCWHDSVNNQIGIAVNAGAANTTAHSTGVADTDRVFRIGARTDNALYWDGLIDEVGLWGRVLTADERTQLYNSGNGLAYPFTTGTGAITIAVPALAGSGTATSNNVTGTGALAIAVPGLAGSGTYTPEPITGSGAVTIAVPALAGEGTFGIVEITGTGAVTITVSAVAGSGTYTPPPITGSGAITIAKPSLRGYEVLPSGSNRRGRFALALLGRLRF